MDCDTDVMTLMRPVAASAARTSLHGRDEVLCGVAGHLVANADASEGDGWVGLDIVADPRGHHGRAHSEGGEHVVGGTDDDADVSNNAKK